MQRSHPQLHQAPPALECPANAIGANGAEVTDLLLLDSEANTGRDKIQRATINNRFDIYTLSLTAFSETDNVSLNSALYQQIAAKFIKGTYKTEALTRLANRLIAMADHALDFKQTDQAEQISHILMNAPLPTEYRNIGQYYLACCIKRRGESDAARVRLERLAESPATPLPFRARALQAVGIIHQVAGDFQEALRFYLPATDAASTRHGNDLLTTTYARWMMAAVRGISGDNAGALADLEKLLPIVRLVAPEHPWTLYGYVNSLAVELGEVGRLEEARRASQFALRSAYAPLYPEWHETRDEIAWKSRRASASVVPVPARPAEPDNVITLTPKASPERHDPLLPARAAMQPARVVGYHEWKRVANRLNQSQNQTQPLSRARCQPMTKMEKQATLFRFIYAADTSEEVLDRLLQAAEIFESDKPCG